MVGDARKNLRRFLVVAKALERHVVPVGHGNQLRLRVRQLIAARIRLRRLRIIAQEEVAQPQMVEHIPIIRIQTGRNHEIRRGVLKAPAGQEAMRTMTVIFPVEGLAGNRHGVALFRLAHHGHLRQRMTLLHPSVAAFGIRSHSRARCLNIRRLRHNAAHKACRFICLIHLSRSSLQA